MNITVLYDLKRDFNNIRFLRENSYWYKFLNRNPFYLKDFKDEMKRGYNLTFEDKLDRFSKNLDKVTDIIDIFS